jgi:hypothetical protein
MKQASFKIGEKKVDNLYVFSINEMNNEMKNEMKNESKKNITSKKPIKMVENIYYFTRSKYNSSNM